MKKYLVLFVLLLSTVTICSFNYKIETIENNSMIVSEDYLKDLIFDMIQIFVQNRGDIVVNEKSNKFDFLIKTGYISDGDVILINFTLYNKIKSRLNDVSYTIPIKSDFLHSIRVSLNQLVSIEPKIKKSTNTIKLSKSTKTTKAMKKASFKYCEDYTTFNETFEKCKKQIDKIKKERIFYIGATSDPNKRLIEHKTEKKMDMEVAHFLSL